jgi:hypothetical protein
LSALHSTGAARKAPKPYCAATLTSLTLPGSRDSGGGLYFCS